MENEILTQFSKAYPELHLNPIWEAYEILLESITNNGKLLVCGNGGSSADADHIVGELVKSFKLERKLSINEISKFTGHEKMAAKLQKGIPAISLCAHESLLSAISNDTGSEMVYAQQVYVYGSAGDVLIAISTSGNSENIVNAAITAKSCGVKVIGITGAAESELSGICDLCLKLPSTETYRIQEYTMPIYHVLCAMLEDRMFK